MANAGQVLKASLQRILVQASESQLEPSEFQDAIFDMNNFMLDLDAKGIALGYTVVENLGDEITIPTGALRGLIANVAIEIAPDYNGTVSPALAKAAKEGLETMRLLGLRKPISEFPSTLPVGSGNEGLGFSVTRFYSGALEAEILRETTGAIGLESETEAA